MNHLGELAAFATALCWTVTGINFELAGKRVGSFAVNIIRLVLALVIMTAFNWVTRGLAFPTDATMSAWGWLTVSGLIGFVIGDLFLFQAYVLVGTRISMLIMATVPPITAVMSYFIFGEKLTLMSLAGMGLTLMGIAMVIFMRSAGENKIQVSHNVKGLLYAFIGAVGQAFGLISSKIGMGDYNAFAATQIRIMAGLAGFIVLFAISKRWSEARLATKDRKAMMFILIGSFFGPFLGVSMSLVALQHTKAAIASTIMSIMPVLIIPAAILVFKEKVRSVEIIGALMTVVGVAILFL